MTKQSKEPILGGETILGDQANLPILSLINPSGQGQELEAIVGEIIGKDGTLPNIILPSPTSPLPRLSQRTPSVPPYRAQSQVQPLVLLPVYQRGKHDSYQERQQGYKERER